MPIWSVFRKTAARSVTSTESASIRHVKFCASGGPKLSCDFLYAQVAFSRVFCTLKIVSGEGCEGKIPEKIPSVPLIEIYRLSYLTLNSVHSKASEIAFFVTFLHA